MYTEKQIVKKWKNWSTIKKAIEKLNTEDLCNLAGEFALLSKENKNFLEARFLTYSTVSLNEYKKQIKDYLALEDPCNKIISIREAKKALRDYKQATDNKRGLIELMVYYVECGNNFTCAFGDMDMPYYDSLISVFENVLKLTKQQDIDEMEPFIERLHDIVEKADGIGWGYYDSLDELFNEFYPAYKKCN